MNSDFPPTGPRKVHQGADGRGVIRFEGTTIESTALAPYIGETVHVHDGYAEHYQISRWLDPPRLMNGRKVRAGLPILVIELHETGGRRWRVSPSGASTLIDNERFLPSGCAHGADYGTFEKP